ncbi:glycosyltransferase family 4 protein [Sphingomonas sp. XMGL2]|uniref:Glycosyltransferase family 4 protein n=2 Tax=Sphingomonas quercus TaxID=2842451 RepID=A0ABS6BM58_9SPHN|nr:glycosyltransferase family 4 protein [Sphingomonas quercus]
MDVSVGKASPPPRRIALVGNHPPRLCGIATFTADVRAALTNAYPDTAVDVYAMEDPGVDHAYPPEVTMTIARDDIDSYREAARRINESGADIVCVQHEYGIYGGPAGAHLLRLLDRVEAPVVVTLHTVLESPNADQRAVIEALVRRAARLIVMAEKGRDILRRVHGVADNRIAVIPHGVPDRPLTDGLAEKRAFDLDGRKVLLTFGLLSPNKGLETMIRAMPRIVAAHPDSLYVVLGATHPHLVLREGERYRESLQALAAELGVADHIRFVDGFVPHELLMEYLTAADIYVTPYVNEAQITSGTLSYAVALGKPVVSTPYWHAAELVSDAIGRLVRVGDADGFAEAIVGMLDDPARLDEMRRAAWLLGRGMTWSRLAIAYVAVFAAAITQRPRRFGRPQMRVHTFAPLPPRLDAVERMTDSCGIAQHAIFTVPDRDHGYCVDDNCRALMLMHRITGEEAARADQLATIYASFMQHAWNGDRGRFRNFMSYDRRWLEEAGSEDSFGRSLWAIGVTVAEARRREMRAWALHLFNQVLPHAQELRSLRTLAFAVLGCDAVLEAHPGHDLARTFVADFGRRIHAQFRAVRREGWQWFEPVLGYDNARLPEAMLRAARRLGDADMEADALAALGWLDTIQTNADGQFRPVGTDSFGRHFMPPLPFDQQPVEAWATIEAMLHAHGATGAARWREAAQRAYSWFLGANDLGTPIASLADGGCHDGLMSDRTNLNQGAESILAYQFGCCAMARAAGNALSTETVDRVESVDAATG